MRFHNKNYIETTVRKSTPFRTFLKQLKVGKKAFVIVSKHFTNVRYPLYTFLNSYSLGLRFPSDTIPKQLISLYKMKKLQLEYCFYQSAVYLFEFHRLNLYAYKEK